MSFPNIPDVDASIAIKNDEPLNLILASIAFEELGLAHILNAEAERIQYVLGTLEGQTPLETAPTIGDLLDIDRSVEQTLKSIINKEILLQFKLENVLTFSTTSTSTTTSTTSTTATTTYQDIGSAWSVGTEFGYGKSQIMTLGSDENEKSAALGLGALNIPVGTVLILRAGKNLMIIVFTSKPYVMNQVHLYVDNAAPADCTPGSFPYQYTATDPADYFTSHIFTVDVSAFTGETFYVAASVNVLRAV